MGKKSEQILDDKTYRPIEAEFQRLARLDELTARETLLAGDTPPDIVAALTGEQVRRRLLIARFGKSAVDLYDREKYRRTVEAYDPKKRGEFRKGFNAEQGKGAATPRKNPKADRPPPDDQF